MNKREINIFVSYSSKDRALRNLLVEGLKAHLGIKRDFKYELWSDQEIDQGENWKEEIEKALKNSEVSLLLVSASFCASDFITKNELRDFFERKKEDTYLILPVLIRHYDFTEFEMLSSIQFFKTYYKEYDFEDPGRRDKLIPFDELGEGRNIPERLLQLYYHQLSNHIHSAVSNFFRSDIDHKPSEDTIKETEIDIGTKNDGMSSSQKVIAALENPNYYFRTLKGISDDAGISIDEASKIIDNLKDQIRRSKIPDKYGNPLYAKKNR